MSAAQRARRGYNRVRSAQLGRAPTRCRRLRHSSCRLRYPAERNQNTRPRQAYLRLHCVAVMRLPQPVGRVQPHPSRRHERAQQKTGIPACRLNRLDLRGLTADSDAGGSTVRPSTRAARRRRSFAPQRALPLRTGSPPRCLTLLPAPSPPRTCAADTRPDAVPAAAPRGPWSRPSSAPSPAR